MANTKYVLSKIKVAGVLQDIIAKSTGDYVTVTYKGAEVTLASALASIIADMSNLPTSSNIDEKIETAISDLIGGAPETYDTLKEIADYIAAHEDVADALDQAIGNKVDKEDGKGLSAEDFTTALKEKLEALPVITATDVESWNNKAGKDLATVNSNGLMSKEDKVKLDGLKGVRYGVEVPEDMNEGEVFIQVVEQVTEGE